MSNHMLQMFHALYTYQRHLFHNGALHEQLAINWLRIHDALLTKKLLEQNRFWLPTIIFVGQYRSSNGYHDTLSEQDN